jgi:hypothetical protein
LKILDNLRQEIEHDLYDSLESEWKMPVELTTPDGQVQRYSLNNPSELLGGQVLYFSRRENPDTGEVVVVDQPVVTIRVSSLIRVPKQGERWYIKMPISPVSGAEKKSFVFTPDRSYEHGTDIGFMRIYPQKVGKETPTVSV